MSKTVKTVLWFVFLGFVFFGSLFMLSKRNQFTVNTGPHQVYSWSGSVNLIGDGETHIYLVSTKDNFTIYDQNQTAIVSGITPELKLGQTVPIFTADFQTQSNTRYTITTSSSADVYTLTPVQLQFDDAWHIFQFTLIMTAVVFWLSIFIVIFG